MAKYKVLKQLNNIKDGGVHKVGAIIERNVSEVEAFENQWGTEYLERVDEPKTKTKAKATEEKVEEEK